MNLKPDIWYRVETFRSIYFFKGLSLTERCEKFYYDFIEKKLVHTNGTGFTKRECIIKVEVADYKKMPLELKMSKPKL